MNIVLYKGERIRFCSNIGGDKHEPIFATMDDWLTPKGLLIPLSRGAVEMREILRDPTYQPDRVWEDTVCSMLLDTKGRIFNIEFLWDHDNARLRTVAILSNTGPNAVWANSYSRRLHEAATVMLHFYEDMSDMVTELNQIVPMMVEGYEEWDHAVLTKHVREEVERRWPANPATAPGG